jgi:hypothetical protein
MKQNAYMMLFYGIFLIAVAVITVALIGWSAKTALFSGGSMGLLALIFAHFTNKGAKWSNIAGLLQTLVLSGVFGWRAWKSLYATLELIQTSGMDEITGKMTAFFMINLMFIVSVAFTGIQLSNILNKESKK